MQIVEREAFQALAPTVRTTISPYIRCVMIFNSSVNVIVYYRLKKMCLHSINPLHYRLNSDFRAQFKTTILRRSKVNPTKQATSAQMAGGMDKNY